MLFSNFKLAFRTMRKNKLDTLLNLIGISLGLACGLLIIFHVQDELSYDRHFSKAERIFRATCEMREGDAVRHWATTSPVLLEHMKQSLPEIERTCRLFVIPEQIVSYVPESGSPRRFKESSGFFADPSVADLFDLQFIHGDAYSALTEGNSIVLTRAMAERFFPNENPMGKYLGITVGEKSGDLLKVTGVVENFSSRSHFDFSYLISFPTFYVFLRSDKDYVRALNLKIIAGGDFSHISDHATAFIINRKAAEALRVDDPVGRIAGSVFGSRDEIVGIVDDFHYGSLHTAIEPLVIEHIPASHRLQAIYSAYLLLRIKRTDISSTLDAVESSLKKIAPGSLFVYSFLDQKLAQLYHSEQRMSDLFKAFALLAIFISCLGLFGLSSYAAQVRVKEIGIRKTLGASLTDIVRLLSGKYLIWILIANAVALPVGYLYMQDWLSHFAYRAHIGGAPLIFTLALTLLGALAATSYHALRAGTANPVKSLRYE